MEEERCFTFLPAGVCWRHHSIVDNAVSVTQSRFRRWANLITALIPTKKREILLLLTIQSERKIMAENFECFPINTPSRPRTRNFCSIQRGERRQREDDSYKTLRSYRHSCSMLTAPIDSCCTPAYTTTTLNEKKTLW